jgi:hypothetical protein
MTNTNQSSGPAVLEQAALEMLLYATANRSTSIEEAEAVDGPTLEGTLLKWLMDELGATVAHALAAPTPPDAGQEQAGLNEAARAETWPGDALLDCIEYHLQKEPSAWDRVSAMFKQHREELAELAAATAAAEARAGERWISVEERMPEPNVWCMLFNGTTTTGYHSPNFNFCGGFYACMSAGRITHWMPMPAPPAAVAAGQGERSGNKP